MSAGGARNCLIVDNICVPWVVDFTSYWKSIEAIVRQSSGSRVAIEWLSSGNRFLQACVAGVYNRIEYQQRSERPGKTENNNLLSDRQVSKLGFCKQWVPFRIAWGYWWYQSDRLEPTNVVFFGIYLH